tara:strand:- start:7493 stop:8296 length:804 start_codon:yes stop_codon:yes gene_type:complete
MKLHNKTKYSILMILILSSASLSGCFSSEEILEERYGVPGGLVLACLDSSQYKKLVVEVDYEENQKPTQETLDLMIERLESACEKESVSYELYLTDFNHDGSWSDEEIRFKGRETRQKNAMDGDELRFHLMFPSGYHSNENVLGVAVDATTVMVFNDRIKESENLIRRPSWQDIETSVTIHELGHLLGLVNLVYTSDVDHEDPDHPGHSSNEESVMYWAIESSDISNIIFGTLPNDFDIDDKNDLQKLKDRILKADNQLWYPDNYHQ